MSQEHQPICTQETQELIAKLRACPAVEKGLAQAEEQHQQRINEQVQLTEVPAPPFHEEERAKVFAQLLADAGIPDVHQDQIGNVIGRLKGIGNGPTLVIGAHIDTVFKEGTPIKVS